MEEPLTGSPGWYRMVPGSARSCSPYCNSCSVIQCSHRQDALVLLNSFAFSHTIAAEFCMDDLARSHKEEYGEPPQLIASAPGRVNLIGEHTDYNEGFVMPIAIDYCVHVAVSRRTDQHLKFYSMDFKDRKRTSISNLRFKKEDRWANYPKAVVSALLARGHQVGGLNLTVHGTVPQNVGLASSAALEAATG